MNDDLKQIVESSHDRPFTVLGPHLEANDPGRIILRVFYPDALTVSVFIERPLNKVLPMEKLHPSGLFAVRLPLSDLAGLDYTLLIGGQNDNHAKTRDPYQFPMTELDPEEEKRFLAGEHDTLYRRCGAHPETRQGVSGVHFGLWAPHARRVSVVGRFNQWDGRYHLMQKTRRLGLWELFIPGVREGDLYKFEIRSHNGEVFLKTDPFARMIEDSPEAASIVCDLDHSDQTPEKQKQRQSKTPQALAVGKLDPVRLQNSNVASLLDDRTLEAFRREGYSHLEISAWIDWNRQTVTPFSPDRLIGTPEQAQALIDRCHRHGLGVIIAVVPQSLPFPPQNLVCFDGEPLYEAADGGADHQFRFALNRHGVQNLLLSYVRFWREVYRVDGFRLAPRQLDLYRHLIESEHRPVSEIVWLARDEEPSIATDMDIVRQLFPICRIDNPFSFLGPHRHPEQEIATVRAILPRARLAYAYFPEQARIRYEMRQLCPEGLWQAVVPLSMVDRPYRLHTVDAHGDHDDFPDTYAFEVSFIGDEDKRLFGAGNHYHIYRVLGAHPQSHESIEGVNFAVWAPNAVAVNVVGDFNGWDGRTHPMRLHAGSGIWELFIPNIESGEHYQYEIFPREGAAFLKSDPYAFHVKTAPDTESVVYPIDPLYQWHDEEWMQRRRQTNVWRIPVSIYEVHLGSWRRGPDNRLLNYAEIADRLIPYVMDMGFTHIEILPIAEHPYEPSWGYQVSNFYAPTSRLGKPEELMAFVDRCHQNGIGVLLDWVAGHFPKDAHALAKFDGTHLYEHEDPRKGEHKDWGTLIFNYGRREVENFLIANAVYWLEHYHFDGLRVDAVASMLYLDYSRKDGEWIPNIYGGNENLEAIEFLKRTNYVVHGRFPGVMMIAEESTAWAGVSRPTDSGGLGFGFKWNMGWMHDILSYLQTPPEFRQYHHNRLSFIFHYAFEENFILSLSHDEVVHLKGSLYSKMPGSEYEKFANLRLLFFFMYTHPGKKLNFMGAEFAQRQEWNESGELQWQLLDNATHRRLQYYCKQLNQLYRNEPVLHEMDCRPAGFAWIDAHNHEQSIIVFCRQAKDPRIALIVVINFSAISRFNFRIGVPYPVPYTEIFNTNNHQYGGYGNQATNMRYAVQDTPWHGQEFSICLDRLPALSALLLRPDDQAPSGSGFERA